MAKALVKKVTGETAVDDLRRKVQAIFAEQALKDTSDTEAMGKWADYTPERLQYLASPDCKPGERRSAGITARQARVALESLKPNAVVPFALKALHERTLARIRRVDDAEGLVRLGFAIGQLPARAERRDDKDVITVEAIEKA